MLNPNEIRTGNWLIKMISDVAHPEPVFEYKSITTNDYHHSFANNYFPIKLTPEILGRCGFKYDFGDWYQNTPTDGIADGLPFLRFRKATQSWYFKDLQIPAQPEYLHQLQNLVFALSARELTVSLGNYKDHVTVETGEPIVNVPPQPLKPLRDYHIPAGLRSN